MQRVGRGLAAMFLFTLGACSDTATTPLTPAITSASASVTSQQVSEWMQSYYRSPKPETVVPMAQVMSANGWLYVGDTDATVIGFFAGIFRRDTANTIKILDQLEALPASSHEAILTAAVLGTPDKSAEQREAFRRLKLLNSPSLAWAPANGIHAIDEVETKTGASLDFLWGAFFATGDAAYVRPIITALKDVNSQDVMILITANAAKWSLSANAREHERIAEICHHELAMQPPEIAAQLRDVLRDAGR